MILCKEQRVKSNNLNFEAFLHPKSIAIIGATERANTWGNWITRRLIEDGIPGDVHPINPSAKSILDQTAYPNV